jgi:hypothetical protein
MAVDTSIDCHGPLYRSFVVPNVAFIFVNISFIVGWIWVLLRYHKKLNPPTFDIAIANALVAAEPTIQPYRFLYGSYTVHLIFFIFLLGLYVFLRFV